MNPLSSALFKAPPRSVFSNIFSNQVSYEMGKLVPIKYFDLSPGDRIKLDFSQLTRFAPLLAPVMHNYKLYVDAVFVPYRLLWHPLNGIPVNVFNAEQFFRMDNQATAALPVKSVQSLVTGNSSYLKLNNLGDYLGYPLFINLIAVMRKGILNPWWQGLEKDVEKAYWAVQGDLVTQRKINVPDMIYAVRDASIPVDFSFKYDNVTFDFGGAEWQDFTIPDITALLESFYKSRGINVSYAGIHYTTFNILQRDLKSRDCRLVDFQDYIFTVFFQEFVKRIGNNFGENRNVNLLPYFCYWRAVADWYVNTNVVEMVAFVREHLTNNPAVDLKFEPFDVFYKNDYFTSAFDSPQSGSAVKIPVNGTISDLRNASSLQSLAERVKYAGTRLVDQTLARFGVKSRNQEPDRTVKLGRKKFDINVTDIMQTSQGDLDSPLANYAGQGYSMSRDDNFVDFQCDEHGMVMVLASLRPVAVYEGQVPRLLYKESKYDFLNPELSAVGEQPIFSEEIFDGFGDHQIFGYQRRYAEYMYEPSEVHGDFRQSLDYWNSARHFATRPALNEDFLKINNKDDFNRIFAVQGLGNHIYSFFYFKSLISRPLPRYVNYSL